MRNLTKNSVVSVAKVGVASALIGAGLFLSACGGGDNQKEKFIKEKVADIASFLTYDDAKKELGVDKDFKQCFEKPIDNTQFFFVKMSNGESRFIGVYVSPHTNKAEMISGKYDVEYFKTHLLKECQN